MQKVIEYFKDLFTNPLSELNILEVILIILGLIAAFFIIKYLIKIIIKVLLFIVRLLRAIFSSKNKCQKVQCPTCGRTLDRCVCEKNRKRGYFRRYISYKKEIRK